jgi:hypothetical protein
VRATDDEVCGWVPGFEDRPGALVVEVETAPLNVIGWSRNDNSAYAIRSDEIERSTC